MSNGKINENWNFKSREATKTSKDFHKVPWKCDLITPFSSFKDPKINTNFSNRRKLRWKILREFDLLVDDEKIMKIYIISDSDSLT